MFYPTLAVLFSLLSPIQDASLTDLLQQIHEKFEQQSEQIKALQVQVAHRV